MNSPLLAGRIIFGDQSALLQDAATLCCGMTQPYRDAARVQIAYNNANDAGGRPPAGINDQQAEINCIVEWTDQQMDEADLLLTCALGAHASQA